MGTGIPRRYYRGRFPAGTDNVVGGGLAVRHRKPLGSMLLALAVVVALSACGSSSSSSSSGGGGGSSTTSGKSGGALTEVMGTAPDYLDPNLSYTSQGWELQWPIY